MDPVVELDQALLGRGSCVCRFYVEGEWQEVKVDSLIPTRRVTEDDGIPMDRVAAYGRSRDPSEHWVSIVEKAYAKLCGSGCASWRRRADALVDYGSLRREYTHGHSVSDLIDGETSGAGAKVPPEYVSMRPHRPMVISRAATDEVTGLLHDRAYGIIMAKEIRALRFIKIRNPWGARGDWRGEWPGLPKWDEHPEVEQAMKATNHRLIAMRETEPCGLSGPTLSGSSTQSTSAGSSEEFNQYLVQGEWAGASAGGATVRPRTTAATTARRIAHEAVETGQWRSLEKGGAADGSPAVVQPGKRRGLLCRKMGTLDGSTIRSTALSSIPMGQSGMPTSMYRWSSATGGWQRWKPEPLFSNFVILRQRRACARACGAVRR